MIFLYLFAFLLAIILLLGYTYIQSKTKKPTAPKQDLGKILNLSQEDLKLEYLSLLKKNHQQEIIALENKHNEEIKKKSQQILVQAMENYSRSVVKHLLIDNLELEDEKKRGKLIGRNGRNIKILEDKLGVNIILGKDSNVFQISCFNPVRRKIAKEVLKKLLNSGKIQHSRIEKIIKEQKAILDETIHKEAIKACEECGVKKLPKEIMYALGKLRFRFSFGQNALIHSIETAKIAGDLAQLLGVNVDTATKAGLLHDVGKALDIDQKGDHSTLGANFVEKYLPNSVIVYSIKSHHDDIPLKYIIPWIVKIADTISASRPGARKNTPQDYIKRINQIESLARTFDGVKEAFAIQGGRELRVLVDTNKINDIQAKILGINIKNKIEKEGKFPGKISIVIIRESRFTLEAYQNKNNN